jgi:phospholipid/cholesterol/gamma-HCH transport system permease protein
MLSGVGQATLSLGESIRYLTQRRLNVTHFMAQLAYIGFDSLPIALIINIVAGCVLSLHTSKSFAVSGADEYVGGLLALAIVREVGPIFTALAVGSRSGTAISAEIANMSVTQQVDALNVLQVSPIRYLMLPRLLAAVVAMPLIAVLAEAAGMLSGMIVAKNVSMIDYHLYLNSVWRFLTPHDIEVSLFKSVVFGGLMALISVLMGLNARGGARQVGLATTQSTVWTAVTVLIADFFLTWIFFGTRFEQG